MNVCIRHSLPGLWWCLWIESEGMYQPQFTWVMVVLVDRKFIDINSNIRYCKREAHGSQ